MSVDGEIEVIDCKELEDGSALLTLELNEEIKSQLISYAINDILRKYLDSLEENEETLK